MTTENKIQRIEAIHIDFEVEPEGYAVDPITHEGTPPAKKTLRERALVTIKFHGDEAMYNIEEPYESQVYDAVWNHLEKTAE